MPSSCFLRVGGEWNWGCALEAAVFQLAGFEMVSRGGYMAGRGGDAPKGRRCFLHSWQDVVQLLSLAADLRDCLVRDIGEAVASHGHACVFPCTAWAMSLLGG